MDIFEYKTIAHELIEEIVESGLTRNVVYKKLLYFLKVRKGEEHIGSMSSIGQVKRAIRVLNFLKRRRIHAGKMVKHPHKELFISGHKRRIGV